MKNDDGTYDKPDRSVAQYWVNDAGRDTDRNVWLSTDDGLYSAGLKFAALGDVQYRWMPITLPTFPPKPEPPKPLEFVAGRDYQTRDGQKRRLLGFNSNGNPVFESPLGHFSKRNADGRFYNDRDSYSDIIAEWSEPNPRVKLPRLFTAKYEGKEVRGCYFPVESGHPADHAFSFDYGSLWVKPCELTDIVYTTPEYEDEL